MSTQVFIKDVCRDVTVTEDFFHNVLQAVVSLSCVLSTCPTEISSAPVF